MRKRPADGWLAVAPIVLTIFWAYQEELSVIHVPTIARIFGLTISVGHIAILLMLAIVSVLLMLRFIRGQRERELWRLEIEQARQVQQVLIPEALPKVPGFQLASDYRPAQQVGGDFFQIMQLKGGGVLAVIGDVSGKGMPAAMTVSLLVGTVRTLVHFTDNPGEILSAMNVRMLARSHGGFTTCLVMRVAPDGLVTVANAGHLSPYCGARELELKNGLPLGLAANSTYPETQFQLGIAEQMTLMTDGVIEARGRNRELYGFERAAAIANHSAESIGRAAQEFGQEDDITVLTLTRVTARQEPISQFTSPALAPSVA
jgi:serine phosphatase RsbU (regulator of sigma subunit)